MDVSAVSSQENPAPAEMIYTAMMKIVNGKPIDSFKCDLEAYGIQYHIFNVWESYFFPIKELGNQIAKDPTTFEAPVNVIKIILTIAHLDHSKDNNGPDNLRALCQKCHLNHDQEQHLKNAAETRKKKNDAKRPLLEGQ